MATTISVPTPDGVMNVFVCTPEARPTPGLLVLSEGFGVNDWMRGIAHRLSRAGHVTAVPDLYHRQPRSSFGYDEVPAAMKVVEQLDDTEILADVRACAHELQAHPMCNGKLGVIGFCIGGRSAFLAATHLQELSCAVVCYGTRIAGFESHVPSLLPSAGEATCPIFGLFGSDDEQVAPEEVHRIDDALRSSQFTHTIKVYEGAGHGFLNDSRPDDLYVPAAAEPAWTEILEFVHHWLDRGSTRS